MESPDARAHLERVQKEDRARLFSSFNHIDAWRLGCILMDLALQRDYGVAIDIRRGTQQVFHSATEGSSADNDEWIERKIRTVHRLDMSSLAARLESVGSEWKFSWLDRDLFAVAGGCVPIRMAGGAIVGTATASGLPDVEDHEFVVEGISRFLSLENATGRTN